MRHTTRAAATGAAQIVTGIGFLCAGVIIKAGMTVFGLNTAATLWATAAVGALRGVWIWREAVVGTVIIIAGNGFPSPLRSGSTEDLKSPIASNRPTSGISSA